MNRIIRRFLQIVLLAPLFLPLAACAATVSSKALEGKVLEEGTNRPLTNAIVIVRWIGDIGGIGHGSSVCYHVEVVATDKQGQFHVSAWKKPSPYGDIAHGRAARYAYAPVYLFVRADKETIYLQPFSGTREERLKYIERIKQTTLSCADSKANGKNLIPLYRALYEEARPLAQTKEEQSVVDGFLSWIRILEREPRGLGGIQ